MHSKAYGHAQHAGCQPSQHKLKGVGQRNGALRLAKHAQHGAVVQVLGSKAARYDGHRHRAKQGGQQRHQIQEFLRPFQRLLHLRAAAVQ